MVKRGDFEATGSTPLCPRADTSAPPQMLALLNSSRHWFVPIFNEEIQSSLYTGVPMDFRALFRPLD